MRLIFDDFDLCIQGSTIHRSTASCQSLGFSVLTDLQHVDDDVAWHYLRHPHSRTLLELLHFKTAAEARLPMVERRSLPSLNRISFYVEDPDQVEGLDQLKSARVSRRVTILEQSSRAGCRYPCARGPHGELRGCVEFVG
jgi:hypothetical protein